MERVLAISPSVIRVEDGQIALSCWMATHSKSASKRAEAVLLHLGRPAHFREINKNIPILFGRSKQVNERTVHNVVHLTRGTFVRVGPGTCAG